MAMLTGSIEVRVRAYVCEEWYEQVIIELGKQAKVQVAS